MSVFNYLQMAKMPLNEILCDQKGRNIHVVDLTHRLQFKLSTPEDVLCKLSSIHKYCLMNSALSITDTRAVSIRGGAVLNSERRVRVQPFRAGIVTRKAAGNSVSKGRMAIDVQSSANGTQRECFKH